MPAFPARLRIVAGGIFMIVFVHLSAVNLSPQSDYAKHMSIWQYAGSNGTLIDEREATGTLDPHVALVEGQGNSSSSFYGQERRANAVFVILVRNSELWQIMESLRAMEDRFNRKYNYPYVFLNDVPFDDKFKRMTQGILSSKAEYGLIPKNQWSEHPSWIDEEKARAGREAMKRTKVIYADSVSDREMCRYQSGFFFRHPLLDKYEYYWRVEPGVKYFCDLDYDPFLFMQDNKLEYGFTMSIYEFIVTIPTLWDSVKTFIKEYPQHIPVENAMSFISEDNGKTYNKCHFWSNFEIASLSLWRSQAYMDFFEHLDKAGGFFYERWGDAPIHSIAAALFLPYRKIHYFYDIGYRHGPYTHCPKGDVHKDRCYCDDTKTFNEDGYSCTPRFVKEKAKQQTSLIKYG